MLADRLLQSEKLSAIGQLIAGVAHDLNNPLTSVVGFADFLAESPDAPPRIREPLRVIQQEATRASKIVKNLLSFARRQESRQRASLTPVLEATVGLFRNQLSASEVTLELDMEPGLPDLEMNPHQVQQVFVNLIQNAAQALMQAERPGTVRVRARRWMDGVAIDVSDDGPGMPPEVAARVFEPFYTTKPEGQGTGLGLSISQGIAKEHGGRITLATEPGKGATFTVELPGRLGEPTPLPAAAEPREARPLASSWWTTSRTSSTTSAPPSRPGATPWRPPATAAPAWRARWRSRLTSSSPTSACPARAARSSTPSSTRWRRRPPPAWPSAPATPWAATPWPSWSSAAAPASTSPSA